MKGIFRGTEEANALAVDKLRELREHWEKDIVKIIGESILEDREVVFVIGKDKEGIYHVFRYLYIRSIVGPRWNGGVFHKHKDLEKVVELFFENEFLESPDKWAIEDPAPEDEDEDALWADVAADDAVTEYRDSRGD